MRGDYFRYISEVCEEGSVEKNDCIEKAGSFYRSALDTLEFERKQGSGRASRIQADVRGASEGRGYSALHLQTLLAHSLVLATLLHSPQGALDFLPAEVKNLAANTKDTSNLSYEEVLGLGASVEVHEVLILLRRNLEGWQKEAEGRHRAVDAGGTSKESREASSMGQSTLGPFGQDDLARLYGDFLALG